MTAETESWNRLGKSAIDGRCQRVEFHCVSLCATNSACSVELTFVKRAVREDHESSRLALFGKPKNESCSEGQRGGCYGAPDAVMTSSGRHLSVRALQWTETA